MTNRDTNLSLSSFSARRLAKAGQHEDTPMHDDNELLKNGQAEQHPGARRRRGQAAISEAFPPLGQDTATVWKVFRQTLALNWRQPKPALERGAIVISGLVNLKGPRASCLVDIQGLYQPRGSILTIHHMSVRSMTPAWEDRSGRGRGGRGA